MDIDDNDRDRRRNCTFYWLLTRERIPQTRKEYLNIYIYIVGEEFGKMILFYGCRNKKEDFIYEDVIYSMKRKRVLDELYLAFSREKVFSAYDYL